MKKIKLSTKPKIIKNESIDTINFVLIYPNRYVREDSFNLDIARMIYNTSSKRFPKDKELKKEMSSKLIIDRSGGYRKDGDNMFVRFELCVPKEGLISDYSLDDAFSLFVDTIYNPLASDGKFDEKKFEYEKEFIINKHKDSKRGIYNISYDKFIAFLDPEENIFLAPEKYLDYYENTTAKTAYDAYKKCVLDNKFISYVYGNISEDRVQELFSKYLPQDIIELEMEDNYEKYLSKGEYEYLEEESTFNQSSLYLAYVVDDFHVDEEKYVSLIGNILGQSENDLIFKTLRTENNLIYSSNVLKFSYNGFFAIETYLSEENKEQAIELVNKTIASLKDREFLITCMKKLFRGMEIEILRQEDRKFSKLDNTISKDLNMKTLEDILEGYKELKVEDIIAFLNRIHLKKVFFLRGENNE